MGESKKSRLAGIAGAIGIAVLALLLIFALNSLQWPLASALGKAITVLPSPTTVPDGVLVVNIQSNLTIIPGSGVPSYLYAIQGPSSDLITESLSGVAVAIYGGSGGDLTVTNYTSSTGQVEEVLAPNTYSVKILDWLLNNLTTSVQVSSDKITDLNVTLNATSYAIQSANIEDPDFSGWAVSWGQIYAEVNSNQSILAHSPTIYLDTVYPFYTPMDEVSQGGFTPITVGSSAQNNGSQWVQIQVNTPLNISSIRSMSILTLRSEYTVNTTVVQ